MTVSEANTFGDSDELEALFDSIADSVRTRALQPSEEIKEPFPDQMIENRGLAGETQVFSDSIPEQGQNPPMTAPQAFTLGKGRDPATMSEWSTQQKVFDQVGHMVRQLRETLNVLGYDRLIEQTVNDAIPDAKDRLTYISDEIERAASRVLNATDTASPLQEELEEEAALLAEKWNAVFANRMEIENFKLLVNDTREFLRTSVVQKTGETREQLLEIMMAQGFQDLTGQVIKEIATLIQRIESQLMNILIETIPAEKRTSKLDTMLNGPVINANGRTDVVVNQEQVDALLDDLGF